VYWHERIEHRIGAWDIGFMTLAATSENVTSRIATSNWRLP